LSKIKAPPKEWRISNDSEKKSSGLVSNCSYYEKQDTVGEWLKRKNDGRKGNL